MGEGGRVAPARPSRAAILVAILLLVVGCTSPPADPTPTPELRSYTPIKRQGTMDVVSPSAVPPRDASPACQVFVANEPMHLHNLTAAAAWMPASPRTNQLLLRLDPPGDAADASRTGPSPLNVTAPVFGLRAGEKFRVLLAEIGQQPTDAAQPPQSAEFVIAFVAERPANAATSLNGLWESQRKCPN